MTIHLFILLKDFLVLLKHDKKSYERLELEYSEFIFL